MVLIALRSYRNTNLIIMKIKKIVLIIILFVFTAYGIFRLATAYYNKVNIVSVTIPEGYTNKELGQTLQKSGLVTEANFIYEAENWKENNYWFLNGLPNDKHKLDGFLFPATYSFPKDASSKTIINAMLRAFEINIQPNKEYLTNSKVNTRNIIITASLIEKEAKKEIDRPKIASVIYNRIKHNMPLQIDATILYIIGHKEKLYNKDLAVKSPYNTYLNKGLPPSPICNPGIKSINAAINPANTVYLYYVLNSKTNEHIFSKTYKEHAKNVLLYIK